MSNVFEKSAKFAIEELILKNSQPSKFGQFISEDQMEDLKEDLWALLANSRNMRVAGEKFLAAQDNTPAPKGAVSRLPFRVSE